MKRARNSEQGMNWCRLSTRLAIYHRDGFACMYCGRAAEDGTISLTLDHVTACELGGTNEPTNLVTCCNRCNSAKGDHSMRVWLKRLRECGFDATKIGARLRRQVKRPIDRAEGRRLVAIRKQTKATSPWRDNRGES